MLNNLRSRRGRSPSYTSALSAASVRGHQPETPIYPFGCVIRGDAVSRKRQPASFAPCPIRAQGPSIGCELSLTLSDGRTVALHGIDPAKAETLRRAVIDAGLTTLADRTDEPALRNAEAVIAYAARGENFLQRRDVDEILAKTRHAGIPTEWPTCWDGPGLTRRLRDVRRFSERDSDRIRYDANSAFKSSATARRSGQPQWPPSARD